MPFHNVTYEIPSGNHLTCISCDEVLKNVADALEHTVNCNKKNRLAKIYDGKSQIKKIKGSVKWTRENIAHLLDVLKRTVTDLGKAKAHYRTYELGRVHDEIALELSKIIGPGITRYQMTRKWNHLQRRALHHERIRKKYLTDGKPAPDPPSFHPSVREIMKCIEEEKIKYLKQMEHSEKSYTLKIKDEELNIPEELCVAKDDNFEFSEVPCEEEDQLFPNDEVDSRSMVLKRSRVLSIINKIDEGIEYSSIIKEFGITEAVLTAIEQNSEAIVQGAQRCSLCRILLSTVDDVVAHEIECSRNLQQAKDDLESKIEEEDIPFIGFLPNTVEQLVKIILKQYPTFTRGIDWSKIATYLSRLQKGVTAVRCSHKWHNLVSKCRRYHNLHEWAIRNNRSHNAIPPEFYNQLIPYAASHLKAEPSQESIDKFLCIGEYDINTPNTDIDTPNIDINTPSTNIDTHQETTRNDKTPEEKDPSIWSDEESELKGIEDSNVLIPNLDIDMESNESENILPQDEVIMELHQGVSSLKEPVSEEIVNTLSDCRKEMKINSRKKKTRCKGNRLQQINKKLDRVLGLLDNVVKENQRLTREAETKKINKQDFNVKLENLTEVIVSTHNQHVHLLQTMTNIWERHHQEHQSTMKSLIAEIRGKKFVNVKRK